MSKQAINTIPSGDASFLSDLSTYLTAEIAQRFQQILGASTDFIVSGGTASTSGTLSHTISACVGYPGWYYSASPSTAHTYSANVDCYVYLMNDDELSPSIESASVTTDGYLCFAEMTLGSATPTEPDNCLILMKVTTNGSSITTVTDLRNTSLPLSTTLGGLLDVTTTGVSNGEAILYDSGTSTWLPGSAGGGGGGFTEATVAPVLISGTSYSITIPGSGNYRISLDFSGISGNVGIVDVISSSQDDCQEVIFYHTELPSSGTFVTYLMYDVDSTNYPLHAGANVQISDENGFAHFMLNPGKTAYDLIGWGALDEFILG